MEFRKNCKTKTKENMMKWMKKWIEVTPGPKWNIGGKPHPYKKIYILYDISNDDNRKIKNKKKIWWRNSIANFI